MRVFAGEEIRAFAVTNAQSYNMSLFVKILHDCIILTAEEGLGKHYKTFFSMNLERSVQGQVMFKPCHGDRLRILSLTLFKKSATDSEIAPCLFSVGRDQR